MPTDELCSDDFWDIEEALVMQYAIDIITVFRVLCFGLLGLLVFGLQFM